jgi:RNA polymerase sigma factor (sigma-70 family)
MKLFSRPSYSSLPDLVLGCQRQERRAQNIFYDRYKNKLKGICLRYAKTEAEADDILQEAFIKIFNHIDQIKVPASADSWVRSVVIRTAINYYHATTKQELMHTSLELSGPDLQLHYSYSIIEQLDVEILLEVISKLPDGYRTIINLYLIDGYSHVQIAEMLSIAEGTSKSQLQRGRTLLIKKLQEKGIGNHEFTRRKV